ncbi:MAG: right-handed parallel beta-helix repeat-containing protein [Acidobacteria bacterium]|nr:right-handed parallel beta-helix repeat-containing protein [Acidobacteriota bacterium]MCB9397922.1 right-handed parallel beta-helix repeat-containing protein [Acidobacteriota bacterium]
MALLCYLLISFQACSGDFNQDQDVNLADLHMACPAWLTANSSFDLDASGQIDIRDLIMVASQMANPACHPPGDQPIIVRFEVQSPSILMGQQVTLEWEVLNATGVHLTGISTVPATGTASFTVDAPLKTYSLIATNANGSAARKLDVVADNPPAAQTWHVAPSGSDVPSNGSAGSPFLTPQYAHDRANPGDTILLHNGTYGRIDIQKPNLTVRSAPGEWAHLSQPTTDSNINQTVRIRQNAWNTRLENLEISGGYYYGIKLETTYDWGQPTRYGANNVSLIGCEIHDTGRDCVKVTPFCHNLLIDNCDIHNSGVRDNSNAEGLDVVNGHLIEVRDSHFHAIATNGLYFKGGSILSRVERCLIEDTGGMGIGLGFDTSPEWFDLDLNPLYYESLDNVAVNNLIRHTNYAGIGIYGSIRAFFAHNTLIDVAQGGQSAITFGVPLHDWEFETVSPSTQVTGRNNVLYQPSGASQRALEIRLTEGLSALDGFPDFSHQIYFAVNGGLQFRDARSGSSLVFDYNQWLAHSGTDANSLLQNPNLDADGLLLIGSPAINSGLDVGVDVDRLGTLRDPNPDRGCHEFVP